MKCSECGARLPEGRDRFCTVACRISWHNRLRKRGAQLFTLYAETRKNRKGKHGLASVNSLMASWFAEDTAASRVSYHPELVPQITKTWR